MQLHFIKEFEVAVEWIVSPEATEAAHHGYGVLKIKLCERSRSFMSHRGPQMRERRKGELGAHKEFIYVHILELVGRHDE